MFKVHVLVALLLCSSLSLAAEPLRDPTRPLQEVAPTRSALPTLELNSVLISEQRRLAVINGQTITEGEQISGATVLRIFPDRVLLRRAGHAVEIRLHSSPIRSNAG